MLRLFNEHHLDQVLLECRSNKQTVDQGEMHHAFCCTITLTEFFEPATNSQVATIHRQDYVDPDRNPVEVIRMFRVGKDVYILELPTQG